ncbi:putative glycolipid 2-alpha-mannosyltransferase [Rosellinia necatrix]|uniref:Putative glycolipid 2-alpha-mannosyltransferase n=1 Tax=Rosellinia necatrix TaxID=77044 RepID=A0A1S7UJV5_ROSNE|nr:putative glycolipid 2-alpha-mannosyltransferase [Rosellinia necatrix]
MMLLWRLKRAARRLPILLLLLTVAPFLVEVLVHAWRYRVPQPAAELDPPFFASCQEPDVNAERENAVFVMLARNKERQKAKKTIRSIEAHFNQWFNYPIVFLNDEPWDTRFVTELNETAGGKGIFEVIPKEQWTFPDWIDPDAAKQSIKEQGEAGIPHAGQEGYHHMCRFYSGKFYQLDALKKYKWYWRLEPDVDFTCAITYDPFVQMAKHEKVYGYTIALWEVGRSCPGLFRATTEWKKMRGVSTTSLWRAMVEASWMPFPFRRLLSWIPHRDEHGDAWSLCHYWSNFEIADMDFFRSRAYQDYFEYLDDKGGFYNERWGDAVVHSLAIAMLANPQQVHHFEDIGYRHDKFYQCPANAPDGQLPDSLALADNKPWSPEITGGVGCRCECKSESPRNYDSYCHDRLRQPNARKRGWFS